MKIKGFRIDKMPFIGFPEEGGGVHDKYSINSLFIIYKHSLMSIKSPKKCDFSTATWINVPYVANLLQMAINCFQLFVIIN